LVIISLISCEDIDGCGSTIPPPFRALVYDDGRNVLYGDDRPDTVFLYAVRDGIRYSERFEIVNIGDSSQSGIYCRFLSESDIPSSNTYYLEIDDDIDTLQVDVVERIDEKGCTYLTYETVLFNGQAATLYPWKRGGGYVLRK
jgi:hypothetical protein